MTKGAVLAKKGGGVGRWNDERECQVKEKKIAEWSLDHPAMRNNMRPSDASLLLSSTTIMASRMPLRSLSRATQLLNVRPWTCSTCRVGSARPLPLRRGVATTPTTNTNTNTPKKPYYVTTPIFYVNAGTVSEINNQSHSKKAESNTVFSTSTACRPSIHHGRGRYLEAMAGPPRRQRCPIVDRHRRAWNEGENTTGYTDCTFVSTRGSSIDIIGRFNEPLSKLEWIHKHFAT